MIRRYSCLFGALMSGVCVTALAPKCWAQENTTYTYDAMGRLTATSISGGSNNGTSTATQYDKATNRAGYAVVKGSTPTPTPSGPPVANFSFEEPEKGNGPQSYQYAPPGVSGAAFSDYAGVAANGSDFGFSAATHGDQVGFLQPTPSLGATITLNVTGLTPGQHYAVRYDAATRPGNPGSPIQAIIQNTNLGIYTPASTSFVQVTTNSFTASGSSAQLTFATPPSGSGSHAAIDHVRIVAGTAPPPSPGVIPHASFEQPSVGAANFAYPPSVNVYGDLYFQGNAGLSSNGSAWGFPNAPAGVQVAFLQSNNSTISTNVSGLTIGGTYTVKFKASRRGIAEIPPNQIYVSFQGNNLGAYTPSYGFGQYVTTSFVANSSTGVLTFQGQTAGDSGSGIDDLQVTSP